MFELNEKDCQVLSHYIEKNYGIQMPASKKTMLQSRLQKRALQLGYSSINQYVSFFLSAEGQRIERDSFATIVSTHKTEFFREIDHFDILKQVVLSELLFTSYLAQNEPLMIWSSASSTGEEIYSLIMTTFDFLRKSNLSFKKFKVIGTDISDTIVDFAKKGIYPDTALTSIPVEYHKYLMRSKDTNRRVVRVVPELRMYADFRQQNLIDSQYRVQKGIHVIFCRNVLIYFERSLQSQILSKLVSLLAPGGFLFIGHAESLSGMNLPLVQIRTTVYKKVE